MWGEFITLAAMGLIQHSIGIDTAFLLIAGAIICGWLLGGGLAGVVIAALTPNAPALDGCIVGVMVAVGAGMVVIAGLIVINIIGFDAQVRFESIPTAIRVVFWVGLVTTAVGTAVIIIRRIGRKAG